MKTEICTVGKVRVGLDFIAVRSEDNPKQFALIAEDKNLQGHVWVDDDNVVTHTALLAGRGLNDIVAKNIVGKKIGDFGTMGSWEL